MSAPLAPLSDPATNDEILYLHRLISDLQVSKADLKKRVDKIEIAVAGAGNGYGLVSGQYAGTSSANPKTITVTGLTTILWVQVFGKNESIWLWRSSDHSGANSFRSSGANTTDGITAMTNTSFGVKGLTAGGLLCQDGRNYNWIAYGTI